MLILQPSPGGWNHQYVNMWVECISTKDPRSRNANWYKLQGWSNRPSRPELCRGFSWLLQGYTLGSSPGGLPGCQKSFGRTSGSSPVMGSWWVTTPKFTIKWLESLRNWRFMALGLPHLSISLSNISAVGSQWAVCGWLGFGRKSRPREDYSDDWLVVWNMNFIFP